MFVLAAALIAVALIVAAAVTRSWALRSREKRTVVVTCKDGTTFRGVLTESDRRCLILKQSQLLSGDALVGADGEVLILLADVGFLQFP